MDAYLRKYNIKPSVVRLEKCSFSKIKMSVSAISSEENEKLYCSLQQVDTNTFNIKVKSVKHDNGGKATANKPDGM